MEQLKDILWKQIGASIDMLSNVIATCPEEYLQKNKRFYYVAYHTIILLDYYFTIPPEEFSPSLPFTFTEESDRPKESLGDMIPDKFYSQHELIDYIYRIRLKAKNFIADLSAEKIQTLRFTEGDADDGMDYPVIEILLYNIRHTQHHVGQLHMMIRQDLDKHTDWIFREGE